MWPTFFIPRSPAGGGTEGQCFDLYTKAVDTTRVLADGFTVDPELQFTTQANRAYWLYGHLVFKNPTVSGNPGFRQGFHHAGQTAAFQSMGVRTTFISAATNNGGSDYGWVAQGLDDFDDDLVQQSNVTPADVCRVFIDAILVTGGSGGVFGVKWGTRDNGAAGSTSLLAGSYITAVEVQRT